MTPPPRHLPACAAAGSRRSGFGVRAWRRRTAAFGPISPWRAATVGQGVARLCPGRAALDPAMGRASSRGHRGTDTAAEAVHLQPT
jgi:hypothetical protein